MKKYPNSFSELKIKDLIIKNRILSSPRNINSADLKGNVSEKTIDYFENIAKNNIGIVTIGGTAVNPQGRNTITEMWVGREYHRKGLKQLSSSIKKYGAKATLQLSHVGPQGNTVYNDQEVVGSSEYIVPDINIKARPLKINEIEKIEDDFANAAILGWESGFDFIEIHLAHGYLIHSFLSEYLNKRKDKYGGTEENRFRIVKNIINKILEKNSDIRLCARISGDDFIEKGLNIINLKNLIEWMDKKNFCYYTVTAGIYETSKQKYICIKTGGYWKLAENLKKITKTSVVAQGGIRSIEDGEILLKNGVGDIFGMCQALIADPEIVTKTLKENEKEIFKCLAHEKVGACHRCRYLMHKSLTFDCITPSRWVPKNYKKKIIKMDAKKWNRIIASTARSGSSS
jgi:NADPH2 dehydrogenase